MEEKSDLLSKEDKYDLLSEDISKLVDDLIKTEKKNDLIFLKKAYTVFDAVNGKKSKMLINEQFLYKKSKRRMKMDKLIYIVVSRVIGYAESKDISYINKEAFFLTHNIQVLYKNNYYLFEEIFGQGTVSRISKLKQKDIEIPLVEWEDIYKFVENNK